MDLFRITSLKDRLPSQLSGDEKQRVARAWVLVSSPRVLLLDEPFGSLDFRAARYLRRELKRIQSQLKMTMPAVTRNIEEVEALSLSSGDSVYGILKLRALHGY